MCLIPCILNVSGSDTTKGVPPGAMSLSAPAPRGAGQTRSVVPCGLCGCYQEIRSADDVWTDQKGLRSATAAARHLVSLLSFEKSAEAMLLASLFCLAFLSVPSQDRSTPQLCLHSPQIL